MNLKEFFYYDNGDVRWLSRGDENSHFNSTYANRIAGTVDLGTGYKRVIFQGKNLYVHRIAWFLNGFIIEDDCEIDHINHNKLDNNIDNLRAVPKVKNQRNRSLNKNNKSGVMGVSYRRSRGTFVSSIYVNSEYIYLGSFKDKMQAICARKSAELRYDFHINHGMEAV